MFLINHSFELHNIHEIEYKMQFVQYPTEYHPKLFINSFRIKILIFSKINSTKNHKMPT